MHILYRLSIYLHLLYFIKLYNKLYQYFYGGAPLKIEKINDDKIKVTFDYTDLKDNNVDFHSFMSNAIQNQELFLKILEQAEENLNFQTDEYKLEINTLALSNGIFILTVARLGKITKVKKKFNSNVVHIKRKTNSSSSNLSIYSFKSFDDFINFCQFIAVEDTSTSILSAIENKNSLFKYDSQYFLAISTNKLTDKEKEFFYSTITEFAKFISNSQTFLAKLKENSICFLPKSAINLCIK